MYRLRLVLIQTGGTFDEGVTVGGSSAFDDYDPDSEGNGSVTTTTTGTTNASSIQQQEEEVNQHQT